LHARAICIYLAGKAEEHYISLEKLAGVTSVELDILSKMEVVVLEGLHFHLRLYNPNRAVTTLLQDIRQAITLKQLMLPHHLEQSSSLQQELFTALETATKQRLLELQYTDAEFLYTHSQIAWACIYLAAKDAVIMAPATQQDDNEHKQHNDHTSSSNTSTSSLVVSSARSSIQTWLRQQLIKLNNPQAEQLIHKFDEMEEKFFKPGKECKKKKKEEKKKTDKELILLIIIHFCLFFVLFVVAS